MYGACRSGCGLRLQRDARFEQRHRSSGQRDRSAGGRSLHPTGPIPKASEWARQALGFEPSPKQAEALDLDPQRMILNCARQWGKSTVIALKALHTAVFQPNKTIIVLSASEYQAGLLIQKVGHNAASLGYQTRRLVGRRFSLEFENGSKILAISHNARTGVGHTADVLIIDEAAHVKDDVVAAIMPTLARTNGKVWMLSTPAGQESLFRRLWLQRPRLQGLRYLRKTGEQSFLKV